MTHTATSSISFAEETPLLKKPLNILVLLQPCSSSGRCLLSTGKVQGPEEAFSLGAGGQPVIREPDGEKPMPKAGQASIQRGRTVQQGGLARSHEAPVPGQAWLYQWISM